jgi:hypothetical protein
MTDESLLDKSIVDLGSVTDEVAQLASTLETLEKKVPAAVKEQVVFAGAQARFIHGRMKNLEQGFDLAGHDQDVDRDGA